VAWVQERTIWTERPRLSAKLVPNFVDRECHMVSATEPYGRILDFLDRSRYSFFQVATQLYSRGWTANAKFEFRLRFGQVIKFTSNIHELASLTYQSYVQDCVNDRHGDTNSKDGVSGIRLFLNRDHWNLSKLAYVHFALQFV
jgi:hypothetical protein